MARRQQSAILPVMDHVALAAAWSTTAASIADRCRSGELPARKKGKRWYINMVRLMHEIDEETAADEKGKGKRNGRQNQGQVHGSMDVTKDTRLWSSER